MTKARPTPEKRRLDNLKHAVEWVEAGDSEAAFDGALKRVLRLSVERSAK